MAWWFYTPTIKSSFDDSESLLEGNQEEHRIFTEEDGDIGEEPDETEFLGDDDSYCMSPNIEEGTPKINSKQQEINNHLRESYKKVKKVIVAIEKPVVLKETEDKIKFLKQFGDI